MATNTWSTWPFGYSTPFQWCQMGHCWRQKCTVLASYRWKWIWYSCCCHHRKQILDSDEREERLQSCVQKWKHGISICIFQRLESSRISAWCVWIWRHLFVCRFHTVSILLLLLMLYRCWCIITIALCGQIHSILFFQPQIAFHMASIFILLQLSWIPAGQ